MSLGLVVTDNMREWRQVAATQYKTLLAMGHEPSAATVIGALKATLEVNISAEEIQIIRRLLRAGQFSKLVDGADVCDSQGREGTANQS